MLVNDDDGDGIHRFKNPKQTYEAKGALMHPAELRHASGFITSFSDDFEEKNRKIMITSDVEFSRGVRHFPPLHFIYPLDGW